MNSHIAIVGSTGSLALKPDTSITITEKNPMFNDVEMFSFPFQLPFTSNRHLVKNLEARDSSMRAVDLEGERFQVVLDGLPMRTAVLKVSDDVVLQDSIDVNLDATNRTFKDMIADMRCRDVTVDDDILIGEKVEGVNIVGTYAPNVSIKYHAEYYGPEGVSHSKDRIDGGFANFALQPETIENVAYQVPVLGFSYPGKCAGNPLEAPLKETKTVGENSFKIPRVSQSFINTSKPYPQAKYCNSRVCYSHRKPEKDDNGKITGTLDELVPSGDAHPENGYDYSPYWVLPAERPASGICFYVAYFLERLFKTLGVAYDMTALTNITDFNYLCFFTTACKYTSGEKVLDLNSISDVNKWLESRGCGGKIVWGYENSEQDISQGNDGNGNIKFTMQEVSEYYAYDNLWDGGESSPGVWYGGQDPSDDRVGLTITAVVEDGFWRNKASFELLLNHDYQVHSLDHFNEYYRIKIDEARIFHDYRLTGCVAEVRNIYASQDNFPEASVTEVIESLENSFGVRFCYDEERNKVTVRLLRDMFRDSQPPIDFKGTVTSVFKMSEKIKGVRMKYSAESDEQEQQDNIRYQKRDYDTIYDYADYRESLVKIRPYSEWTKKLDVADYNCYVDLATGNAYRVKVSSEASTMAELKPSAFEVAGLKGVDLGDCSKENEDYIREIVSSFEPIITNNLKDGQGNIHLIPFVDEDMEHEFIEAVIRNPCYAATTDYGYMYVDYHLCLPECYDPTQTDDGQSPLMNHDWGLTVGILRPGRGGQSLVNYDYNYDGFGNYRWTQVFSDSCITSDTFNATGQFLGTNAAGSFSLKPRAYKPFRYYYDKDGKFHLSTDPKEWSEAKWLIPCNADTKDTQGVITSRRASRGMCDTFMIEFFRFLLNRQRYQIKAICTAAELLDISNKWLRRWNIDGKIGYINQVEYTASAKNGIGEATIDFFSI